MVLLVRVVGIVLVIALVDASRRRGRPFFAATLADDARGRALLHGLRQHGRGGQVRLNLPSGPVIILIAGAVYLLVAVVMRLRKRHGT